MSLVGWLWQVKHATSVDVILLERVGPLHMGRAVEELRPTGAAGPTLANLGRILPDPEHSVQDRLDIASANVVARPPSLTVTMLRPVARNVSRPGCITSWWRSAAVCLEHRTWFGPGIPAGLVRAV